MLKVYVIMNKLSDSRGKYSTLNISLHGADSILLHDLLLDLQPIAHNVRHAVGRNLSSRSLIGKRNEIENLFNVFHGFLP